ncbi:hypothetical protein DAMA08_022650 [Martiniozyma asiatica (nom. inval.)]|nr:hypothetical protein DAMA08_022650 [Martiniozyma asiatica]
MIPTSSGGKKVPPIVPKKISALKGRNISEQKDKDLKIARLYRDKDKNKSEDNSNFYGRIGKISISNELSDLKGKEWLVVKPTIQAVGQPAKKCKPPVKPKPSNMANGSLSSGKLSADGHKVSNVEKNNFLSTMGKFRATGIKRHQTHSGNIMVALPGMAKDVPPSFSTTSDTIRSATTLDRRIGDSVDNKQKLRHINKGRSKGPKRKSPSSSSTTTVSDRSSMSLLSESSLGGDAITPSRTSTVSSFNQSHQTSSLTSFSTHQIIPKPSAFHEIPQGKTNSRYIGMADVALQITSNNKSKHNKKTVSALKSTSNTSDAILCKKKPPLPPKKSAKVLALVNV